MTIENSEIIAIDGWGVTPARTIDAVDLERIIATDSAEEAVQAITEVAKRKFNLTYGARMTRRWIFGEREAV